MATKCVVSNIINQFVKKIKKKILTAIYLTTNDKTKI